MLTQHPDDVIECQECGAEFYSEESIDIDFIDFMDEDEVLEPEELLPDDQDREETD
jgi:hypothetical protein